MKASIEKNIKQQLTELAKNHLRVDSLDDYDVVFEELTLRSFEERTFNDDGTVLGFRIVVWQKQDGIKSIRFLQEMVNDDLY